MTKKAYADWGRWEKNKVALHELGFDLLEIPRRAMTGKNSADIRMVVDALELVISKEDFEEKKVYLPLSSPHRMPLLGWERSPLFICLVRY